MTGSGRKGDLDILNSGDTRELSQIAPRCPCISFYAESLQRPTINPVIGFGLRARRGAADCPAVKVLK